MKLYDFHRHPPVAGITQGGAVLSFSLYEQARIPPGVYFSIGLHPWDSARADAVERVEKELPRLLALPRCLALGECGLDRLKGACMDVQQDLLARQLEAAENARKPLVVHCVRAWSELIQAVRQSGFKGAKAVHGFRGSTSTLEQLLAHDWYISVGMEAKGKLPEATRQIPDDRLLLETDASGVPIESVYRAVSHLKGIPLETAQAQIERNVMRFFGKEAAEWL